MNELWRERYVARLLILVAALGLWTLLVSQTGGFALSLGALRLSATGIRNPLIGIALCVAAAWVIAPPGRRWRYVTESWSRVTRSVDATVASWDPRVVRGLTASIAGAAGIAVIVVGITKGAFVAGGSDSYGYVSQAHLWAAGTLRVASPLGDDLPEGLEYDALVPLGYRLAPDGRSSVPTYAPGFPMLMAVFELVGGRNAVFYAMPVLAGITVWSTYVLGVIVGGRAVGLLAALLMAASPPFLFQLTHAPMSDIVAACWWTLTLVLLPRTSPAASVLMGVCAAAAILTRPNLVPLALVPAGWLAWNVVTMRSDRRPALARLVLYTIGPLCAGLTIAVLNRYWYGSATTSGYGTLAGEMFRWGFLWPNVVNYARALIATQTPAIILAVVGPMLVRSSVVVAYVLFAVVAYLCYAPYLPMEAWWALRFFLPAFPVVFVFMGAAIVRGSALLPVTPRVVWPVIVAALLFFKSCEFVRNELVLESAGERRFADIGRYIDETLPARSVLFSVAHSGSATYYSGRLTVRFDAVPPERIEAIASDFRQRGYAPFILLDRFESEEFEKKFGPAGDLGTLDAQAAKLVPYVALYRLDPSR